MRNTQVATKNKQLENMWIHDLKFLKWETEQKKNKKIDMESIEY